MISFILHKPRNLLLPNLSDICVTSCFGVQRHCNWLPIRRRMDQLLPFYCGDPRGPFDIAKVGAIFVQVKYRNETSSPSSILRETFFAVDQADIYSGTRGHGVRKNFQNVVIDDPNIKLLFILQVSSTLVARSPIQNVP
jgi:hypothetical protein